MKNSQLKEPNPKVNLKDIIEGKEKREQNTFTANGITYWADRISKDQLATHADCIDCGIEFEKDYTYQKYCFDCQNKKDAENFEKLKLVEWDGKACLHLYDSDDKYFFSQDEIEDYLEDLNSDIENSNNWITIDQLRLVLCEETSFGEINISELFQDKLSENWDYDKELQAKENEFNKFLKNHSTRTWMPTNKRVKL
jgi:hypothetical protein